ncbi:tetratricopeptide repeat protein [Cellulomonas septica]|uniref:Tetratricopeptide repeat protein n=1 Tax=Cellulomonas septica TaxID=285080 RepID=A0ABX1JV05_9CELL|nr:hypothetical protein [Cellulomonas septica]NKY38138.1 hypothetical protein [Cellulomonas septica]
MTAARGLDERFVVPRWRTFASTLAVGELDVPRVTGEALDPSSEEDKLDLSSFVRHPGLHLAGDLLGRALHGVEGAVDALPISEYVLGQDGSSAELRRLAVAVRAAVAGEPVPLHQSFEVVSGADPGKIVRAARTSLRRNPRNPVRWIDLALAQTNSGELEKAERSIRTALALAPTNRFVLRAASRFFVHVGDPERAQAVVRPAASRMRDPWLLAAEIAAADIVGAGSELIPSARRSLRSGDFTPAQASELACAIASHEFEAGQDKSGKRLLDRALVQPTENAVAQAEFEARRGNFTLPDEILSREGTFEARAIAFGARSQWREAVRDAKKWQEDQSFAPDPAMYLSYVASVCLEDYYVAAEAAKVGLVANPGSAMLGNNYAFALANLGRVEEAEQVLDQYPASAFEESEQAVRIATLGLLAFRGGKGVRGRELYRDAFVRAVDAGSHDQAAFAAAFWAREELRLGSPMAGAVLEVAREAVRRSDGDDPALVLARVERDASGRAMSDGRALDPNSVPGLLP